MTSLPRASAPPTSSPTAAVRATLAAIRDAGIDEAPESFADRILAGSKGLVRDLDALTTIQHEVVRVAASLHDLPGYEMWFEADRVWLPCVLTYDTPRDRRTGLPFVKPMLTARMGPWAHVPGHTTPGGSTVGAGLRDAWFALPQIAANAAALALAEAVGVIRRSGRSSLAPSLAAPLALAA